jgi:hypothetical protein
MTLKKRLYEVRMEEGMTLVCLVFWCEMCLMWVKKLSKKIKLVKSYDYIMMPLLGEKNDLIILKVIVVLLNYEFLRQHEENILKFSSMLVTALDWRR